MLYIGEFNSGASEISIPILNQAGIAQISPANTYDGLTLRAPGTAPGEPQRYYPTGTRTFMRLTAPDTVQAAALLTAMHADGCRRLAIANDHESYGEGLAGLLREQSGHYGVSVVSDQAIDLHAANFTAYARSLARARAGCFMFAGISLNRGVDVTRAVGSALPGARLYGGDGMCTTSVTDPRLGGLPRSDGRRFQCTSLPMPTTAYPGGRAFLRAYRAQYHADPDAYAIYAYEAMKLGLDTIAGLGSAGSSRATVLAALRATAHRHSVLGVYGFTPAGDTTLRSYGLWGVGAGGQVRFLRNAF